jgi:hypothetical protein
MEIQITGVVRPSDYQRALVIQADPRAKQLWVALSLVLLALAGAAVAWNVMGRQPGIPPGVAVFLGIGSAAAFSSRKRISGVGRGLPMRHSESFDLKIDDNDISMKPFDGASTKPWSGFSKAKIAEDMVLLYPEGSKLFLFLPRSLFPGDSEWQTFVNLVQSKISATERV